MSDYVIIAETPLPRNASCEALCRDGLKLQLVADGRAKPDRNCNAADSIQWKFGVSNITKHVERTHSMRLKECHVFVC